MVSASTRLLPSTTIALAPCATAIVGVAIDRITPAEPAKTPPRTRPAPASPRPHLPHVMRYAPFLFRSLSSQSPTGIALVAYALLAAFSRSATREVFVVPFLFQHV